MYDLIQRSPFRVVAALLLTGVALSSSIRAQSGSAAPTPPGRPKPVWVTSPVAGPGLQHHVFKSAAAGENVSYLIYLPPNYETSSSRYPVVYWLHGIGGSQQGVPAFCERLTRAIETDRSPPMIVVFVNGMVDSFYRDAVKIRRPVETVIMRELIPHIDATWRTIGTREGRAVEGFSIGGFGAAYFAFKYPASFGACSMIDAALVPLSAMKSRHAEIFERVYGGRDEEFTAAHPTTLLAENAALIKGRTVIRQVVGPLLAPNETLHAQLTALGVAHDFQVFAGAPHSHSVLYDRLGDANWDFYRKAFAAIPASSTPP